MNQQKLKLLHVARMLVEETDDERGLTLAQIIERLEERGIAAERKALYRDFDALRAFGLNVQVRHRAPAEYAIEDRAFTLAELQLMIDAVQSSRFLTQRKSDALVRGIRSLASAGQRERLVGHVHVEGRVASQEESVLGNVDTLQHALVQRRRVRFRYFKHDAAKQRSFRRDGAFYCETPVALVYSDGAYYLVAYNEKHDGFPHYRVDRMCDIHVTDEPAVRSERVANFSVSDLESRAFGMYRGEETACVLRVEPDAMSAVMDRFGKDVEALPQPDGTARVYATVMKSPVFFGWVAQFGAEVRIEKPVSLAHEYRAYLEGIVAQYGRI